MYKERNIDAALQAWAKSEVEWIAGHPKTTYDEMAEYFGVSRQTIYTDTKKLQDLQIVIREGEDKNGIWKLNDK